MKVCEFTQGLLTMQMLQPNGSGNQHQHERGRRSDGRYPPPCPPRTLRRADALIDSPAKLRPGRKPVSDGLSHSLQLQTAERVCGARRTSAQVRLHFRQLAVGKLGIHVTVELRTPAATHLEVPRTFAAISSRIDFLARESRDITVPIGIPIASAIS